MSVYVDKPVRCIPTKRWPYASACHLFGDTPKELHEFAVNVLHLRKSYFHKGSTPHYDLTKGKWALAVANGAIEVEHNRLFLDFLKRIRKQWEGSDQ